MLDDRGVEPAILGEAVIFPSLMTLPAGRWSLIQVTARVTGMKEGAPLESKKEDRAGEILQLLVSVSVHGCEFLSVFTRHTSRIRV